MKLKRKNALVTILAVFIVTFFISCDKDPSTIGVEVIGGSNFETKKASFDVVAYNRKLQSVRTDGLTHYQLGSIEHPVFGRTKASVVAQLSLSSTNPTFGSYSASREIERYNENQSTPGTNLVDNEMETVTAVYLNIPYFSQQVSDSDNDGAPNDIDPEPNVANADGDSDGVILGLDVNDSDPTTDYDNDGVTDEEEAENGTSPYLADTDGDGLNDDVDPVVNCTTSNFEIDSIYGNRAEAFMLKVSKLNDFLQNLDPSTNLEETKAYFSNDTFDVDPTPLYENSYQIVTSNYAVERQNGGEDDPDTVIDESITCEIVPAGIRVELTETAIFQDFLDAEGSDELATNANFSEYLRGLMIEVEANDLMMLLGFSTATPAFISVDYDYQRENDGEVVVGKSSFKINLVGKVINVFEDEEYPSEITFDEQNPDNLYVKGGSGAYVELNLFDEDNSVLGAIPKSWLINEANLIFHVNDNELSNYDAIEDPARLYLYNLTDERTLVDYSLDFIGNDPNVLIKYPIFGGVLDEDDNGGSNYKFRITEHINRLIRKDSTNVKLGLFITSNISNTINVTGKNSDLEETLIPQTSIINPFGTILYGGSENTPEENRLKLEIYYTEP